MIIDKTIKTIKKQEKQFMRQQKRNDKILKNTIKQIYKKSSCIFYNDEYFLIENHRLPSLNLLSIPIAKSDLTFYTCNTYHNSATNKYYYGAVDLSPTKLAFGCGTYINGNIKFNRWNWKSYQCTIEYLDMTLKKMLDTEYSRLLQYIRTGVDTRQCNCYMIDLKLIDEIDI